MTKNIGSFLQEVRKDKGLTQKELAEQIGISDKTISKWENGNSVPDTSMLLPLCEALGITVNEFLSCEKILPENYSVKAEENIMALIEENKRTQKGNMISKIVGGVVVFIGLIFLFITNVGDLFRINNFIDLISLIEVMLIEVGVILISGTRTKEKIVQLLSKTILPVGLLCSFVSVIIVLIYVPGGDAMALRVNLAVAIMALLYSIVVKVVVEIMLAKE